MRSLVLHRPAPTLRTMRRRLASIILVSLFTVSAVAADMKIVRVWPSYRTAESFDRIAEYFGGGENSSHRTVLRTQSGDRAGYYFLVRLVNPGVAQPGCSWQLHVIMPTSAHSRTFAFAAEVPTGNRVYELGLTGADWPNAKTEPVAWKLVLQSADGRELVSQQSFLWDRPPTPAQ
jgi:hypothetical protein